MLFRVSEQISRVCFEFEVGVWHFGVVFGGEAPQRNEIFTFNPVCVGGALQAA
jgi:hypothetical protein